jgi:hypothetical protein
MLTLFADSFVFNATQAFAAPQPFVRISPVRMRNVTEGDSGEQRTSFIVSLSEASAETVTVRVDTETFALSGWATEGVDFKGVHRTLTFLPGETQKRVNITIFGDTAYEGDEMFALRLTRAEGAVLDTDATMLRGYVFLADNDLAMAAIGADWVF